MGFVSCLSVSTCHPHFFELSSPFSRCDTRMLHETEEPLDFVMRQVSINLNNTAGEAASQYVIPACKELFPLWYTVILK